MTSPQQYRIRTILPGWSGSKAGVQFVGGEAVIEVTPGVDSPHARALAYFAGAGYGVDLLDPTPDTPRPAVRDPKETWVSWAVALGASEADVTALTKTEIIERYGAETGADQ